MPRRSRNYRRKSRSLVKNSSSSGSGYKSAEPNIPLAPTLEFTSLLDTGTIKLPKSADLICRKLSKKSCLENPDCTYSEKDVMCIPRYTLSEKADQKQSYDSFYFESRRIWREGTIQWLKDEDCNLGNIIQDIKVFMSKKSVSETIILFGKIKPGSELLHSHDRNIAIKIGFTPKNPLENLLEVERAIYKNIITNLVNNKHTPNLMAYLGDFSCTEANFIIPREEQTNFKLQYDNIDGYIWDKTKYHLLITEKALDSKTLDHWILKESHTRKEILSVIFQILYTLVCFYNIGLSHNDLHPGNIFIEDLGRDMTMYFNIGENKYVKLITRYIPKIYDFDRGSIIHPAVPMNLGLDIEYCKDYGTCNFSPEKFDIFRFVSMLFLYLLKRDTYKYGATEDHNMYLYDMYLFRADIYTYWMSEIMDVEWFNRKISSKNKMDLVYLENPSDTDFNDPQTILTKFVHAEWKDSDKPWIEITANKTDLPADLVYTPPEKTKIVLEEWTPVSTETHMSLSVSIPDVITSDYSNDYTSDLKDIWITELIDKYSYNFSLKLTELLNEVIKIKPEVSRDNLNVLYSKACSLLINPYYHSILDNKCKNILACGSEGQNCIIKHIIDDIWNMFSNRLPVKIIKFVRMRV